jgi:hypothetical protein
MKGSFEVNVGLHQGSALSPLLFDIVFHVATEEVRKNPPRCLLYALEFSVAGITGGRYQGCCVTEMYQ